MILKNSHATKSDSIEKSRTRPSRSQDISTSWSPYVRVPTRGKNWTIHLRAPLAPRSVLVKRPIGSRVRLRNTHTKPSIPRIRYWRGCTKASEGRETVGALRALFSSRAKGKRDGNLSDLLRGNIRFFSPSAKGALFLFCGDGGEVKYDGGRRKRECMEMMD